MLVCSYAAECREDRPVVAVNTLRIVVARIAEALVDLGRTELIVVAIGTDTSERVDVVDTRAAIQTRSRLTLVHVQLTQPA